jgi:hypothetical protein
MSIIKLKYLVKEIVEGTTSLPDGLPSKCIISLEDFLMGVNESDLLGSKNTPISPDDLHSYLGRVKNKQTVPTDKYKFPFIHASNIPITDENGNTYDLEALKKDITTRPDHILKQNAKSELTGGGKKLQLEIGLPALLGLGVNEKTSEFVIVNTCPGAGSCKINCYAKGGSYIMFQRSQLNQTRMLNFVLNDPDGFVFKLSEEITAQTKKLSKQGKTLIVRWHDSGDFFSPDYLDIARKVANKFPEVEFIAYTKMAYAMGDNPPNLMTTFSHGATPDQENKIDFDTSKQAIVVPLIMFKDLVHMAKNGRPKKDENEKIQFNSKESFDELRKRVSDKYHIEYDTILSYDELMKSPVEKKKTFNVIVVSGDGDDAASRPDVLGIYLLEH